MIQRPPTETSLNFLKSHQTGFVSERLGSNCWLPPHLLLNLVPTLLNLFHLVCQNFARLTAFKIVSVWANTSDKNIKKLQAIQNFACKIVTNTKKYDLLRLPYGQLNWLPLKKQLEYRDTVMTYKCLNNLEPTYLSNKFVTRSELHDRRTRSNNLLNIPLFRTTSGQRTFHYWAVCQDLEQFGQWAQECAVSQI